MIQTSLAKRWKPRNAVYNVLLIECKTVVDGSKKIVVTHVPKIYLLQQLFFVNFYCLNGNKKIPNQCWSLLEKLENRHRRNNMHLKHHWKKPIIARDIKTGSKFDLFFFFIFFILFNFCDICHKDWVKSRTAYQGPYPYAGNHKVILISKCLWCMYYFLYPLLSSFLLPLFSCMLKWVWVGSSWS